MTAEARIAILRGADDVLGAFRARADALDLSRLQLDRLCGWKSGQAAKYLCDPAIRGLSLESFITLAAGLGAALVLIEDAQALAQIAKMAQKRDRKAVRANGLASMFKRRAARRIIQHFGRLGGLARCAGDPEARKRIAAKGGRARRKALSPEARRQIAQDAAVIRWERVKAAVRVPATPARDGRS